VLYTDAMETAHNQFLKEASDGHWWYGGRKRILNRLLHQGLSEKKPRKLLEVGAGAGSMVSVLKQFGELTLLEPEKQFYSALKDQNPDVTVINEAALTPLNQKYDVICMFDVLEHIESDDAVIEWMHDHLNPGGKIFITVPAFPFLWSSTDELSHHFRRYTRSTLEQIITPRFKVNRLTYFNTFLFPIIFFIRKFVKLKQEGEVFNGKDSFFGKVLEGIFFAEWFGLKYFNFPFGVSLYVESVKKEGYSVQNKI